MKMNRILVIWLVALVSSCNLPRGVEPISQEPQDAAAQSIQEEPNPASPTATIEQPSPTPPTATFEPPAGFKEYQDLKRGISLYYPESWIVTGVIGGQYAIFQSYPEDKYIGGEGFQSGDTKCDLHLGLEAATPEDLLSQWTSDSMTTIVTKEQVTLGSGLPGLRVEFDSMGRSLSMFIEINEGIIALTCYGALEYFDEIGNTLGPLN